MLVQIGLMIPASMVQQLFGDSPLTYRIRLGLPPIFELVVSRVVITLAVGVASWTGIEIPYILVSMIAYIGNTVWQAMPIPSALKPAPFDARAWPPMLRNPVATTSIADLWSRRWHRYATHHCPL